MGTNYYWSSRTNICPHCNRADEEELHIGKSSCGWCFSVRLHPDHGINALADWEARFTQEGSEIRDEYGEAVTAKEMMEIITERDEHQRRRHPIDGRCIANGAGTYDLFISDFC